MLFQQIHSIGKISGVNMASLKAFVVTVTMECFKDLKIRAVQAMWKEIEVKDRGELDDEIDLTPDELWRKCRIIEPDPHPHPVNGQELANEIKQLLISYVFLPEGAAATITCWIFHTYIMKEAGMGITPRLAITSSHKRSGRRWARLSSTYLGARWPHPA